MRDINQLGNNGYNVIIGYSIFNYHNMTNNGVVGYDINRYFHYNGNSLIAYVNWDDNFEFDKLRYSIGIDFSLYDLKFYL